MTRARIILADDESFIRMNLREELTSLGYQIVGEASEGRKAIELARLLRPELVIMDIMMPDGVDGLTAARELTAEQICPVVILTAYPSEDLIQTAKEVGVYSYLVKPHRTNDLMPAIEMALSRFSEYVLLRQEVNELKESIEARKIVERAKGVLMDRYNLKEAEAFQRIRKASMDSRKPMRQIAEAILLTHDMDI